MLDQTQMKQLIQAAEQVWYACAHQTCLVRGCPNEQNIAHQTREQKKCFTFLIECLMAFKCYQTRPNTIKQHQTRCPNGKMFGGQTMFDVACVADGIREGARGRATIIFREREFNATLHQSSHGFATRCSRLRYQNKSTRARNSASYAGYV